MATSMEQPLAAAPAYLTTPGSTMARFLRCHAQACSARWCGSLAMERQTKAGGHVCRRLLRALIKNLLWFFNYLNLAS
jgi:hypothetical protein